MSNKYLEKIAASRAVKEALKSTSLKGGALSSAKGAYKKVTRPIRNKNGDVLNNREYVSKMRELLKDKSRGKKFTTDQIRLMQGYKARNK